MSGQFELQVEERKALLERAVSLLQGDERVVAAWLHGSLGRGDADEWSDIDLWIVVEDDSMAAVGAARNEFVMGVGVPILCIEAPQNAPLGGAYLLAMYAGHRGPQILDCSWQPWSQARRPRGTVLLFEKESVPMAESPKRAAADNDMEAAIKQTRFFWMMTTIVTKYIARRKAWDVIGLLSFLSSVKKEIQWLVREVADAPGFRDTPDFAPPVNSWEQVSALRYLMADVSRLMASVPGLNGAVPPEVVLQAEQFLALVEGEAGRAQSQVQS